MSLKKQILKTKNVCKVTFSLSKDEVNNAATVNLVGEFNEWNESKTPLKKFKNGNFKVTVDLEKGKNYQFKYLIDGETWINDSSADSYIHNDFSGENSVVITE
ncbi:MAG: isoamylase early set domain-containing protein [Bacteroidota bacterium]